MIQYKSAKISEGSYADLCGLHKYMKLIKNTNLSEKVKEALLSVLPITLIVLLLSFTVCPLPNDIFISFFTGAIFMVVGIGLFSLGAETSMTKMGAFVGTKLTASRKILVMLLIPFIMGILITASEPDLKILAGYTPIDTVIFVIAVSLGVGLMLAVAVLQIIFSIKIKYILLAAYGIILILSFFVDPAFLPVAFDAGGVTTGALSVPFIISIGAGISAIAAQKSDEDNSFGLMAVCSTGPIIIVMIMGLIMGIDSTSYSPTVLFTFENSQQMGLTFLHALPTYIADVAKGLLPIVIFFYIFQFVAGKLGKNELAKITIGALYTFIGIVLFLTGVNVGFMPVGSYIGHSLASGKLSWSVIPVGALLGYFITSAEPAVRVLEKQAEAATSGMLPPGLLSKTMAIGIATSSAIAMARSLYGIPLLPIVIVGYLVALSLSFFVPGIFTAIAFDAGGVASGAMTATFLLPMSVGVCEAAGGNIMTDAFGVIALVAMTPAITVQVVGLIYKIKLHHSKIDISEADTDIVELGGSEKQPDSYDDEIIEFDMSGKI